MKGKIATGVIAAALTLAGGLVMKWEGTRYVAYQDSGGVWTICEGHTKGVKKGDTATLEQCAEYRRQDLNEALGYVLQCIDVPLTANQLAAFVDATYNVGPDVVCNSTLRRKANAGDIKGACSELLRWKYADRVPLPGLELRRKDDRALCWPSFSNVMSGSSSMTFAHS